MRKVCDRCHADFETEDKRRKFCSRGCYHAKASERPSATAFGTGNAPWNKGLKGIHLSPGSEFKKGDRPVNVARVGDVRLRNDKGGNPRAWVKVAEPNRWVPRAQVNWSAAGLALKPGEILHHKSRNTLDDSVENLEALSRRAHAIEHARELAEARELARRRMQVTPALPFEVANG